MHLMCSQMWHCVLFCFFFPPLMWLFLPSCNRGFCYLGCCASHLTMDTDPGAHFHPEPRWLCQGHCPPTSLKPCWSLLLLLLLVFAVEPGKLGASVVPRVWRTPLPGHSWALEVKPCYPQAQSTICLVVLLLWALFSARVLNPAWHWNFLRTWTNINVSHVPWSSGLTCTGPRESGFKESLS